MSRNEPFITVVVPTYNRADLIGDTIKSLLAQDYQQYEILVIDDGSTDNTEQVVNSLKADKVSYIRKNNAERAAARNYGANLAKGDYVNFFDSDDIALPNHLLEASKLITTYNMPEWFHLGYAWATPEQKIFREVNNYKGHTLNSKMASGNPLSCNGVFLRKDIILLQPFNEDRDLSASEDYELWLRLAARYPLHYSNTITSFVIDHEMRSVRRINGEKLIRRLELLVHYLQKDPEVMRYFGKDFSRVKADAYSYISLHLAEAASFKMKSVGFLLKALAADTSIINNRRFYAIIKNLLVKWQGS